MSNVIEGIFAIVLGVGAIYFMYSGVIWFAEKFMGARVVSRTNLSTALHANHSDSEYLKNLPSDLIAKAIVECNSKGFAKTHSNIVAEIERMRKKSKEIDNRCNEYYQQQLQNSLLTPDLLLKDYREALQSPLMKERYSKLSQEQKDEINRMNKKIGLPEID